MSDSNSKANELLSTLNHIAEDSINQSPEEFIQTLPERVCQYFNVPICIIWVRDDQRGVYKILTAAREVDDEYKKTELDIKHPGVQFPSTQKVFHLRDITQDRYRLADKEELNNKGWKSLLSTPLKINQEVVGILDIFTKKNRSFKSWEKKVFLSIANYATLSLQKIQLDKEKLEKIENLEDLTKKLHKLTEIMLEITNASNIDKVYKLLLQGALQLVTPAKIMIYSLDYQTGMLNVVKTNSKIYKKKGIKYGNGVLGKSLEIKKPILIDNVNNSEFTDDYISCSKETKSELAIPILVDKIQVRIGKNIKKGWKAIGVLNLESPQVDAFSETDKNILWSLALHSAIEIERIRTENKIKDLRKIEQEIANQRDYKKIIQAVINGITKTLNFDIVNISLVNPEGTHINSEYVVGIPNDKINDFKSMASHALDSDDIQADILRTKRIEVPELNDKRLDKEIFDKFNHKNLIRVFIPMIEASSSNNKVLGTVEAGYNKTYCQYIYEWDVQLLESFVNVATQTLERKKSGWLECITHELRSPIVGIQANVSFLQRRMNEIGRDKTYLKFQDILTDCTILLYQVRQLEYCLGGRIFQKPRLEDTFILRDIITKTTHQLKPLIDEYQLPLPEISHKRRNTRSIVFYTDKAKLNQVVYNLLVNAIKYSDQNSDNHKIVIEIVDSRESLIIKFKDWGIGINEKDKDKIFDFGFRCDDAKCKNISGSGLGLSISKDIMSQLRGDLKLIKNRNPTEFHILLYKSNKLGDK